jgi:hypothetical protein
MSKKLVSADALHAKWMKEPKYRKAYDDLEVSVGLDDDRSARPRWPGLGGALGAHEDEGRSRRAYGNARRPLGRKK